MTTLVERARAYLVGKNGGTPGSYTDNAVAGWLENNSPEVRGLKAAHDLHARTDPTKACIRTLVSACFAGTPSIFDAVKALADAADIDISEVLSTIGDHELRLKALTNRHKSEAVEIPELLESVQRAGDVTLLLIQAYLMDAALEPHLRELGAVFNITVQQWPSEQRQARERANLANLPEGVVAVGLDDPAELHNTIADAVGEPEVKIHKPDVAARRVRMALGFGNPMTPTQKAIVDHLCDQGPIRNAALYDKASDRR